MYVYVLLPSLPHFTVPDQYTLAKITMNFAMRLSKFISSAVLAMSSYFHWEWNVEILQYTYQVPPYIRDHIEKMYLTLFGMFASSAFGFYLLLTKNIGIPVAVLGYFVCIIWFHNIDPWRKRKRILLLITGALFGGASLGPLFALFLHVNSLSIVIALVGISLAFGCFWAASKSIKRRDSLFFSRLSLYNPPPHALVYLLIATLVGSCHSNLWMIQIYTALMWFRVYVEAYNLDLRRKVRQGDYDYVKHAITFFTNSPSVCVRLLKKMYRDVCRFLYEKRETIVHYLFRRH